MKIDSAADDNVSKPSLARPIEYINGKPVITV